MHTQTPWLDIISAVILTIIKCTLAHMPFRHVIYANHSLMNQFIVHWVNGLTFLDPSMHSFMLNAKLIMGAAPLDDAP